MNACCGHGTPEHAYIQFSPTERIGGLAAFERMQQMKAADPPEAVSPTCPDCHGSGMLHDIATRTAVDCFCIEDARLARINVEALAQK